MPLQTGSGGISNSRRGGERRQDRLGVVQHTERNIYPTTPHIPRVMLLGLLLARPKKAALLLPAVYNPTRVGVLNQLDLIRLRQENTGSDILWISTVLYLLEIQEHEERPSGPELGSKPES